MIQDNWDVKESIDPTKSLIELADYIDVVTVANEKGLEREFQKIANAAHRNKNGVIQYTERSAFMIMPRGSKIKALSHLIIPKYGFSIMGYDNILKGYVGSGTFPHITIMADAETDEIYYKLVADVIQSHGLMERRELILSTNEAFFNDDPWKTALKDDQNALISDGFNRNMAIKQGLGKAINAYAKDKGMKPRKYGRNGRIILANELSDIYFNVYGYFDTNNTVANSRGLTAAIMYNNDYVHDDKDISEKDIDTPYELYFAHIHPQAIFTGLDLDIANYLKRTENVDGNKIIHENLSANDVGWAGATQNQFFNTMMSFINNQKIVNEAVKYHVNTSVMSIGAVAANFDGVITGSRHLDVSRLTQEDADRNQAVLDMIAGRKPIHIPTIAKNYMTIADLSEEKFGKGTSLDFIGARDDDSDGAMLIK